VGVDDEAPVCSAKGCREPATAVLVWNNPRLHSPDREKTWVACGTHRQSLADHLDVRGFLRRVDALPGSFVCAVCGASFPTGQSFCPVCAGLRTGSCGSPE